MSLLQNVVWQYNVISRTETTAPSNPTKGDRYIIAGTGGAWSSFNLDDIVEWDGTQWLNTVPQPEFGCYVIEEEVGVRYFNNPAVFDAGRPYFGGQTPGLIFDIGRPSFTVGQLTHPEQTHGWHIFAYDGLDIYTLASLVDPSIGISRRKAFKDAALRW